VKAKLNFISEIAQKQFSENEESKFSILTRYDAQSGWISIPLTESQPTNKLAWLCIGITNIEVDDILFDHDTTTKVANRILLEINASLKDLLKLIDGVQPDMEDGRPSTESMVEDKAESRKGEGKASINLPWRNWKDVLKSKPAGLSSPRPRGTSSFRPGIWDYTPDAVLLSIHDILTCLGELEIINQEEDKK
jgi:hypothetical protein